MKINSIFVLLYIFKGGATRLFPDGCFYALTANIRGSVPPCNSVMGLLPLNRCRATGQAEPFFISATQTFLPVMLYTEKECLTGRSTPASNRTPNETGDSITQKFIIEKAAKNRAYAFILSRGLLFEFRDFCRVEKFILRGFPHMRRQAEKIIEPLINQK